MKRIILKAREERRILSGHPWVYDNEIAGILDAQAKPAVLEPGELAEVESSRKEYLGRAFANPNSKITARIYSPSKEGVDKGFFKRRIRKAILARSNCARSCFDLYRESARLVFAEADFLPGLIIDRFVGWPLDALEAAVKERPLSFENAVVALGHPVSWLGVQFLAYGMDSRRELVLDALEEVLAAPLLPGLEPLGAPTGIVEKSGAKVRELEGLPLREGLARGNFPPSGIVIFENKLPFALHLEEGQKTGHFLDQRDNRRLAAACLSVLSQEEKRDGGPKVLDAFSYTGCFGIHAARAGAESAVCVDVSAAALETVKVNAALNGLSDRIKTLEADVFDFLRTAERKKERYDLVILDPPAFAKTRPSLEGAIRGYKEINLRAISLLSKGGILVTSSCSQAMDEANFRRVITEAAADSGKRLVETDFRHQSADHPILVGYDESSYLKCGFYKAVD
jgi:23S rRNA (cytosine1962-C5)-methyltransferase